MIVFIISFGTMPRVVAKFQTDWFRDCDENGAEEKKRNYAA